MNGARRCPFCGQPPAWSKIAKPKSGKHWFQCDTASCALFFVGPIYCSLEQWNRREQKAKVKTL